MYISLNTYFFILSSVKDETMKKIIYTERRVRQEKYDSLTA